MSWQRRRPRVRIMAAMPRLVVFDVNETLLDTRALEPEFVRLFGSADALAEWFRTVLLYSQATTLAGAYDDFSAIAGAALEMLAAARGTPLPADARTRVLEGLVTLPPHADAQAALRRLKHAGLRLVALSNSSPGGLERQLAHAGLAAFFERIISVEAVRRFKPAPEVYQLAAARLGAVPDALWMVAAHAWDVMGAMRAGCHGAFIARPGKVLYPLAPRPEIVAPDLEAAAGEILAREAPEAVP